jgi:hypothetical protein
MHDDFDALFDLFAAENGLPDDADEETLQFLVCITKNWDRPEVNGYFGREDGGFDEMMFGLGFSSILRPNKTLAWGRSLSSEFPNPQPIDMKDRN